MRLAFYLKRLLWNYFFIWPLYPPSVFAFTSPQAFLHSNHHKYFNKADILSNHIELSWNRPSTLKRSLFHNDPYIFSNCDHETLSSMIQTHATILSSSSSSSMNSLSSMWISAVETFDGSTIINPVVVSNNFWVNLQSKIASAIIGQLLAALAFAVLSTVLARFLSSSGTLNLLQNKPLEKSSSQTITSNPNKKNDNDATRSSTTATGSSNIVTPDFSKLLLCIIIDTIGTSSELIPILGEATDIVYAPLAAYALRSLFQNSNIIFVFELLEEILPFTDILPLATICWVVETFYGTSDVARLLQIESSGASLSGNTKTKNKMKDSAINVPYKIDDE